MLFREDFAHLPRGPHTCSRCTDGEPCPAVELDRAELVAFSRRLLVAMLANVMPELLADATYRRELAGRAWRLALDHDAETRA